MAISLPIISQPPSLNPRKPSIIDSFMNQVFEIKLLVDNFGALLLHGKKSVVINVKIHLFDDRLQ